MTFHSNNKFPTAMQVTQKEQKLKVPSSLKEKLGRVQSQKQTL